MGSAASTTHLKTSSSISSVAFCLTTTSLPGVSPGDFSLLILGLLGEAPASRLASKEGLHEGSEARAAFRLPARLARRHCHAAHPKRC